MGHGAWCITVRVSEHALVHSGAMPHAPCDKPCTVLRMRVTHPHIASDTYPCSQRVVTDFGRKMEVPMARVLINWAQMPNT